MTKPHVWINAHQAFWSVTQEGESLMVDVTFQQVSGCRVMTKGQQMTL